MEPYQKPYFTLFSAVCDTIDTLEKLLAKESLAPHIVYKIDTEVHRLKAVQQAVEEQIIVDPDKASV